MAVKAVKRLKKFKSASQRGNIIDIGSLYLSSIEMINIRWDKYPSLSSLDFYIYGNKLYETESIEKCNKIYKLLFFLY